VWSLTDSSYALKYPTNASHDLLNGHQNGHQVNATIGTTNNNQKQTEIKPKHLHKLNRP
jgi:hypothetical protein